MSLLDELRAEAATHDPNHHKCLCPLCRILAANPDPTAQIERAEAERIAAWITSEPSRHKRVNKTLVLLADALRRGDHRPAAVAIARPKTHRLVHTVEAVRADGVKWGWVCSCEGESGCHLYSQYAANRDWFLHVLHADVAQIQRVLEARA